MPHRLKLKDHFKERRIYQARIIVCILILSVMVGLLVWRYFSLQVLQHEHFQTESDKNRIQLQAVAPKRGLIYDKNGVLLADNLASHSLTIVKEQTGGLDEVLEKLRAVIEISEDDVKKFKKRLRHYRPYQAVPIKFRLSEEEIAIISVNRFRLPGVDIEASLNRYYPQGEYFAHAIGYVGRINEREQADIDTVNYSATNHIGKIGIEKYYEEVLHGVVGYEHVETDAKGRVLRVLERTDPKPGTDLHLYLDIELQKLAHDTLGDERGAIVAMDTKTGGILALASTPSFDANLFVNGISHKDYKMLRENHDLPLFNRAIQGQYPPGSTIKSMIALAGLHYDVFTTETQVRDPGWWSLPNDNRIFRDWTWKTRRAGHGEKVGLKQAIAESCDVYFYELAFQLGIDRMHEFSVQFGLGEQTGIDITNERSGLMPSRDWKRKFKRRAWYPGETINTGIGQGYMLATPVQLVMMTAIIANKGQRLIPKFLKKMGDDELKHAQLPPLDIKPEYWDAIFEGMHEVVHGKKGTARKTSEGAQYEMAGKTGTAQVVGIAQGEFYNSEELEKRKWDHALYVGFAPYDDPQIAVAVIVENGEHGSSTAAPMARIIFDKYLLNIDPVTAEQTQFSQEGVQ